MKLTSFTQSQDFYARAESFLLAREAEHNLMLGLCKTLIEHPSYYPHPPYLAIVESEEEVVAAALRTPPHNLNIARPTRPGALDLFVRSLVETHSSLPGVLGSVPFSKTFAEQWQAVTGQKYHLHRAERIYQIDTVEPVVGVAGQLRRATVDDRSLLIEWLSAFHDEALGVSDPIDIARTVDYSLSTGSRQFYFWHDQRPVAIACSGRLTPHGAAIGPVYTPPEHRRHGYASACTAALSQLLLDSGRQFCFLYTDLGNPTSNHIYQAIGYNPVCDVDEYTFVEAAQGA